MSELYAERPESDPSIDAAPRAPEAAPSAGVTPETAESAAPAAPTPSVPPRARAAKPRAVPPPLVQPVRAAAAWREYLPAMTALPTDTLVIPEQYDVPRAVQQALGALPRLAALRDEAARQLPAHPREAFEQLEALACAAWFAHAREELAVEDPASREALYEKARLLRDDLLVSAEPLARRGLLDAQKLAAARDGAARDVARELTALFELYTWSWGEVHNKTPVTQEEVAAAGALAQRLMVLEALAAERSVVGSEHDAGALAARAFSLFARAYEQCRRAATYLRWFEGDANDVLPPLPAAKKPRAAKA